MVGAAVSLMLCSSDSGGLTETEDDGEESNTVSGNIG